MGSKSAKGHKLPFYLLDKVREIDSTMPTEKVFESKYRNTFEFKFRLKQVNENILNGQIIPRKCGVLPLVRSICDPIESAQQNFIARYMAMQHRLALQIE